VHALVVDLGLGIFVALQLAVLRTRTLWTASRVRHGGVVHAIGATRAQ
jgi:hypothetical protein